MKTKNAGDFQGEWKSSQNIEGIYLVVVPKKLLEESQELNSWWNNFKSTHQTQECDFETSVSSGPILQNVM